MSVKNSSDAIGNRTRDLPTCSAVLQPTAPPRAPYTTVRYINSTEQSRINTKVTDSVAAEFESSILPQPAIGHNFDAVQSSCQS